MKPTETQFYVGVKLVEAWPEEKDGKPGYAVKYEDGYTSWSPKDVFERAYLELGPDDPTKVPEMVVEEFIGRAGHAGGPMGRIISQQLDEKTTLVTVHTPTGFVQHEVSSCVDPANYDHELGVKYATERIKTRVWHALGFVLQWARDGLNR